MREWVDVLIGIAILFGLSIAATVAFLNHERLYAWPFWAVAGFGFVWLVGFVIAISSILGEPYKAKD